MDAVAEAAGVSKLTAYKYFGSKQELFATAVAAKCEAAFGDIDLSLVSGTDLRACLNNFGNAFLALVLDPAAMATHRLIGTERARNPELGLLFYESAVRPVSEKLAAIIARHEASGEIWTGTGAIVAAQHLLALWRGRPFMMIELIGEPLSADELAAYVAQCVDFCLLAWSRRTPFTGG